LREGVASLPLLRELGVREDHLTVTGDDAIAHAFPARPATLGSALGVNLRVAPYSGLDDDLVQAIGTVVLDAAQRLDVKPLPIPISRAANADDLATVRRMLGDPGLTVRAEGVSDLLALVARCRVVVSGSYHAAVIALSMGIPVVTVAKSAYYLDKFRGLAGQFGRACQVELGVGSDLPARLGIAIDDAWRSAEDTRIELLESAARQVALGEAAYARLFRLVETRGSRIRR
jgi:colanic acid/amylovoran biosynthesis protein